MSDLNKFNSMRNIGNAYVEMRKKEQEVAQAKVEAEKTVVETETKATPVDATVEPTNVNEAVNAYTQTSSSVASTKKAKATIADAQKTSAKYVKSGDDAEEVEGTKKAKKNVTINPDLKEDGHTDVSSAMRKCKTIAEDAQEILAVLQTLNPEDGLPSWWMNAIAVSANELNSMRDYIKNPKTED